MAPRKGQAPTDMQSRSQEARCEELRLERLRTIDQANAAKARERKRKSSNMMFQNKSNVPSMQQSHYNAPSMQQTHYNDPSTSQTKHNAPSTFQGDSNNHSAFQFNGQAGQLTPTIHQHFYNDTPSRVPFYQLPTFQTPMETFAMPPSNIHTDRVGSMDTRVFTHNGSNALNNPMAAGPYPPPHEHHDLGQDGMQCTAYQSNPDFMATYGDIFKTTNSRQNGMTGIGLGPQQTTSPYARTQGFQQKYGQMDNGTFNPAAESYQQPVLEQGWSTPSHQIHDTGLEQLHISTFDQAPSFSTAVEQPVLKRRRGDHNDQNNDAGGQELHTSSVSQAPLPLRVDQQPFFVSATQQASPAAAGQQATPAGTNGHTFYRTTLKTHSLREAERRTILRKPLKLSTADDWREVLQNEDEHVKDILKAFDEKWATAPTDLPAEKRKIFTSFQNKCNRLMWKVFNKASAEHDESAVRVFLHAIIDSNRYGGPRKIGSASTNVKLTCSERVEDAIEAIKKYTPVRYDIMAGKRLHEFAANPKIFAEKKMTNAHSNRGREYVRRGESAESDIDEYDDDEEGENDEGVEDGGQDPTELLALGNGVNTGEQMTEHSVAEGSVDGEKDEQQGGEMVEDGGGVYGDPSEGAGGFQGGTGNNGVEYDGDLTQAGNGGYGHELFTNTGGFPGGQDQGGTEYNDQLFMNGGFHGDQTQGGNGLDLGFFDDGGDPFAPAEGDQTYDWQG